MMEDKKRFSHSIVATGAIVAAVAASVAMWLSAFKGGGQIVVLSRQTSVNTPTTNPAPTVAVANVFKGSNVFVSTDRVDERTTLKKLIAERGGNLQSQLTVETDFVVIGTSFESGHSSKDIRSAKDLHVPVLNQSGLRHLNPVQ